MVAPYAYLFIIMNLSRLNPGGEMFLDQEISGNHSLVEILFFDLKVRSQSEEARNLPFLKVSLKLARECLDFATCRLQVLHSSLTSHSQSALHVHLKSILIQV
jgi:hypothetical protein